MSARPPDRPLCRTSRGRRVPPARAPGLGPRPRQPGAEGARNSRERTAGTEGIREKGPAPRGGGAVCREETERGRGPSRSPQLCAEIRSGEERLPNAPVPRASRRAGIQSPATKTRAEPGRAGQPQAPCSVAALGLHRPARPRPRPHAGAAWQLLTAAQADRCRVSPRTPVAGARLPNKKGPPVSPRPRGRGCIGPLPAVAAARSRRRAGLSARLARHARGVGRRPLQLALVEGQGVLALPPPPSPPSVPDQGRSTDGRHACTNPPPPPDPAAAALGPSKKERRPDGHARRTRAGHARGSPAARGAPR